MTWNTERQMKYRVLLQLDDDGAWVAEVPALPGCVSQGRTREEAVVNVREALAAYLRSEDSPLREAATSA